MKRYILSSTSKSRVYAPTIFFPSPIYCHYLNNPVARLLYHTNPNSSSSKSDRSSQILLSFVARHLFGRFSSRREANAGSQMAFPKSCSLAFGIRVLRDTGMVGQSRARLPLQRPQLACTRRPVQVRRRMFWSKPISPPCIIAVIVFRTGLV